MTVNPEVDAVDRNLQPLSGRTAVAERVIERRFEKCGCDSRPREQTPLFPVGTRFAAIIGWW